MVRKDNNPYFCQQEPSLPYRLAETFSWYPHTGIEEPSLAHTPLHHVSLWHSQASMHYSASTHLCPDSFTTTTHLFSPVGFPYGAACCTQRSPCMDKDFQSKFRLGRNGLTDVECKYSSPKPYHGKLFQHFSFALNKIFFQTTIMCEKSQNETMHSEKQLQWGRELIFSKFLWWNPKPRRSGTAFLTAAICAERHHTRSAPWTQHTEMTMEDHHLFTSYEKEVDISINFLMKVSKIPTNQNITKPQNGLQLSVPFHSCHWMALLIVISAEIQTWSKHKGFNLNSPF